MTYCQIEFVCEQGTHYALLSQLFTNPLSEGPGPCSLRMSPIGHRSWLVQRQHNWLADDAWLRPGMEIAFRDSHIYRPAATTEWMIFCQVCWRTMR
jgi:hypothetical protein